jgi:hypothetical protein
MSPMSLPPEPMFRLYSLAGLTITWPEDDFSGLLVLSIWRVFAIAISMRGRWIDFAWCERRTD